MLKRLKNGKLLLAQLDLEILLGDLFLKCKNKEEIDWLYEEILSALDMIHDEAINGEL